MWCSKRFRCTSTRSFCTIFLINKGEEPTSCYSAEEMLKYFSAKTVQSDLLRKFHTVFLENKHIMTLYKLNNKKQRSVIELSRELTNENQPKIATRNEFCHKFWEISLKSTHFSIGKTRTIYFAKVSLTNLNPTSLGIINFRCIRKRYFNGHHSAFNLSHFLTIIYGKF